MANEVDNLQETFLYLFCRNVTALEEGAIVAQLDVIYFSDIIADTTNQSICTILLGALPMVDGVLTVSLFEQTPFKTISYTTRSPNGPPSSTTWNDQFPQGQLRQLVSDAHIHTAGMPGAPMRMLPLLVGTANRHARRFFLVREQIPRLEDLRSSTVVSGPPQATPTTAPTAPIPPNFAALLLPFKPSHPTGLTDLANHPDSQILTAPDFIIAQYTAWQEPRKYLIAKNRLFAEIGASGVPGSGVNKRTISNWAIWAGRQIKDGSNLRPEKCERLISMFVLLGWLTIP